MHCTTCFICYGIQKLNKYNFKINIKIFKVNNDIHNHFQESKTGSKLNSICKTSCSNVEKLQSHRSFSELESSRINPWNLENIASSYNRNDLRLFQNDKDFNCKKESLYFHGLTPSAEVANIKNKKIYYDGCMPDYSQYSITVPRDFQRQITIASSDEEENENYINYENYSSNVNNSQRGILLRRSSDRPYKQDGNGLNFVTTSESQLYINGYFFKFVNS